MKKWISLLLCVLLLAGCAVQETSYEVLRPAASIAAENAETAPAAAEAIAAVPLPAAKSKEDGTAQDDAEETELLPEPEADETAPPSEPGPETDDAPGPSEPAPDDAEAVPEDGGTAAEPLPDEPRSAAESEAAAEPTDEEPTAPTEESPEESASGEPADTPVPLEETPDPADASPGEGDNRDLPSAEEPSGVVTYVLNTNPDRMRVHLPTCRDVGSIKPENREDFYGTLEEAFALGYVSCGHCKPGQ